MNRVFTSLAAALTTAALVASGGSAHAEEAVVDDPFRDVWQTPDYSEGAEWHEIGTRVNVDIDRSLIRHRAHDLVASITYRNLRKRGDRYVAGWKLRTDAGREFLVGVDAESGRWAGDLALFDLNPPPAEGELEGGVAWVECDGSHHIDYSADRVKVWLPRSCIGDPVWVRGMSLAESFSSDDPGAVRDHGLHRGQELQGWTERLSVG